MNYLSRALIESKARADGSKLRQHLQQLDSLELN